MFELAFLYRKVSPTAKEPVRATNGSWGFDLFSDEDVKLKPKDLKLVSTGLVVKPVFKYAMIALVPRSSLAIKKRVIMPNSMGIIDADYCSDEDIVKVPLLNISDETVTIARGERIAQLICFKVVYGDCAESPKPFTMKPRGGFGSTGGYKK